MGLSAFINEVTMTLKTQTKRTTRSASLLLAIFASLFYHPIYTQALGNVVNLPTLADFSRTVQNGNAKMLRGVVAPHGDDLQASVIGIP